MIVGTHKSAEKNGTKYFIECRETQIFSFSNLLLAISRKMYILRTFYTFISFPIGLYSCALVIVSAYIYMYMLMYSYIHMCRHCSRFRDNFQFPHKTSQYTQVHATKEVEKRNPTITRF